MDWAVKRKLGLAVLHGMTIGSLATSAGFYIHYGQWEPMVICAGVACAIEAAAHFSRAFLD